MEVLYLLLDRLVLGRIESIQSVHLSRNHLCVCACVCVCVCVCVCDLIRNFGSFQIHKTIWLYITNNAPNS